MKTKPEPIRKPFACILLLIITGCNIIRGTDTLYTRVPSKHEGIHRGNNFVIQGENIYFLAYTHIAALNRLNGKVIWSTPVPDEIAYVGPVLHNSHLFIMAGGAYETLYAINAANGSILWSRKHRASTIIAGTNLLYLNTQGGDDVLALDPSTGKEQWFSSGTQFGSVSQILVHKNKVFTDTRILHATTGEQVWSWPKGITVVDIAVGNDLVFAADHDGTILALDIKKGKVLWRSSNLEGKIIESMKAMNSHLYVAAYDGKALFTTRGEIVAFDADKGSVLWQFRIESPHPLYPDPLSTSDAIVYVVTPADEKSGGRVIALNSETGKPTWCFRTQETLRGPALAIKPYVYVRTAGYDLVAINEITRQETWVFSRGKKDGNE